MDHASPSKLDDYLFDLNGYLRLEGVVGPDLLAAVDREFDAFPALERGDWYGGAQRRDYTDDAGFELHNAVELGDPFEELLDHSGWIDHVRKYCGEQGTYVQGLFVDETIASVRVGGGRHPLHSGGFRTPLRCLYRFEHGVFRCSQVNVLIAIGDIGEEDGPTMVVPASHKANLPHPAVDRGAYGRGDAPDGVPGAIPITMRAGDALLFSDALMHGGGERTRTDGERRVVIYRYGVAWARTRYGYRYSDALLERLTPTRRLLLERQPPIAPGDTRLPQDIVFNG